MAHDSSINWQARYTAEILRRLARAKRKPTWQHLPPGHMWREQGLSPEAAADLYLDQTVFGRQRGVLPPRAKTSRRGRR